MRNKALTFSLIGCLSVAWLLAASVQPNLADLLDQEVAAQPRPAAALADLPETASANMHRGRTKNSTFQRKPFMCKGQPWPKALMTQIADPKQQHLSITYCIPSGAKPLIGPAEILTADVPSANVQTPGAPPGVQDDRRWADGMAIPAARRAVLS